MNCSQPVRDQLRQWEDTAREQTIFFKFRKRVEWRDVVNLGRYFPKNHVLCPFGSIKCEDARHPMAFRVDLISNPLWVLISAGSVQEGVIYEYYAEDQVERIVWDPWKMFSDYSLSAEKIGSHWELTLTGPRKKSPPWWRAPDPLWRIYFHLT